MRPNLMSALALTVSVSYLLGSIPFGYVLVKVFRGQDIRQTGSGNIGATNVSRTSPALGILTLVFDALKGLAAVAVTRAVFPEHPILAGVAAVSAVVGHVFPIWLKFRGGKGVATGLGSFILLAPKSILAMVALFAAIVLAFRYVSLASITAVALFPFLAWILDGYRNRPRMLACMALASILIIAKHHENIRRLFAGTENRFQLRRG
jgi:acyl phosphate:glycerol-3-phosphate acyltransferase